MVGRTHENAALLPRLPLLAAAAPVDGRKKGGRSGGGGKWD